MSAAEGPRADDQVKIPDVLPVLPLRDLVVYPFIIAPLSVARDLSIAAVDKALSDNRMILLTAQRDKDEEEPGEEEIFGIGTVAVYSEVDRQARHVKLADEAYLLGPAPAAESYLRGERIIEICQEAGAEAVHPGYGFLSENADFAEALEAAGR